MRQSSATFYAEKDVVVLPVFSGLLLLVVFCEVSILWERTIFVAPILHYNMVIPTGFVTESSSSFIAKSNVFLSWTIWCLKHQLHDNSLACSRNGSKSSHDNGWPIFFRQLLRITKAVVNQFVNFNPRKIRELMIFFGISRLIPHVKQKPFILKCQRLWANSSYNWQRHFISVTYFTHGNPVTMNWKLISFYLHAFKT